MYNKLKLIDFALAAKDIKRVNSLPENEIYKEVEPKHLRAFKAQFLEYNLDLIETLENDILEIEYCHNHLIKYKELRNFEENVDMIKNKNEMNYNLVSELEERFLIIYNEIKQLKELNEDFLNIDEELEKIAKDLGNEHTSTNKSIDRI